MKSGSAGLAWAFAAFAVAGSGAPCARAAGSDDGSTVDLGTSVPQVKDVSDGLFPDAACEDLKAQGYKCLGFKPAVRFALPSSSFRLGSADLPDGLKRQLDVFAEAIKGHAGAGRTVRIEGHADASGSEPGNESLSRRRAEAAREYLVTKGVAPDMLKAVGVGSNDLADPNQPLSPRNRRVVIERDQAASAP